jgi:thioredoxin 1
MEITDKNFSDTITNSGKVALIDFWAPWCGPCRVIGPIIDELSTEYSSDKITIGKVNVDENPEIALKFGIRSIPTLLLLNSNGEISEKMIGSKPKSEIANKINELIKQNEK